MEGISFLGKDKLLSSNGKKYLYYIVFSINPEKNTKLFQNQSIILK